MRYKDEKYGSKSNNLTKPLFDLLSLDLVQLIANFLPGVMMAKIVYENIKRISERFSKNNHGELSRQGVLINGVNVLYLNKTERNKDNNDDTQSIFTNVYRIFLCLLINYILIILIFFLVNTFL